MSPYMLILLCNFGVDHMCVDGKNINKVTKETNCYIVVEDVSRNTLIMSVEHGGHPAVLVTIGRTKYGELLAVPHYLSHVNRGDIRCAE
jgi:hypothetical protein